MFLPVFKKLVFGPVMIFFLSNKMLSFIGVRCIIFYCFSVMFKKLFLAPSLRSIHPRGPSMLVISFFFFH